MFYKNVVRHTRSFDGRREGLVQRFITFLAIYKCMYEI